jgi:hypothetical protein
MLCVLRHKTEHSLWTEGVCITTTTPVRAHCTALMLWLRIQECRGAPWHHSFVVALWSPSVLILLQFPVEIFKYILPIYTGTSTMKACPCQNLGFVRVRFCSKIKKAIRCTEYKTSHTPVPSAMSMLHSPYIQYLYFYCSIYPVDNFKYIAFTSIQYICMTTWNYGYTYQVLLEPKELCTVCLYEIQIVTSTSTSTWDCVGRGQL